MPKTAAKPDSATQALLPLWTPSVQIPQGDGSVLVKPGRPVERLTPLQFAQAIGYSSRGSIYSRLGSEEIPERFIERVGPRNILIQAAAIEHFKAYWRERRDGGMAPR